MGAAVGGTNQIDHRGGRAGRGGELPAPGARACVRLFK